MMILALLQLLAAPSLGLAASSVAPDTHWTLKLSQAVMRNMRNPEESTSRQNAAQKGQGRLKIIISDPNFYGYDGEKLKVLSEEEFQALTKTERETFGKLMTGLELVRNHELNKAKSVIATIVEMYPGNKLASEILSEIAIHEFRYGDALLLLAPNITETGQEFVLLMAAHAGAMENQVFEGQKQFTDRVILQASGNMVRTDQPVGAGKVLSATKLSTTLALASWYGSHAFEEDSKRYFNRALELDPKNVWANYSLGRIYARQKLWRQSADCFLIARQNGAGILVRLASRGHLKAEGHVKKMRMLGIGG